RLEPRQFHGMYRLPAQRSLKTLEQVEPGNGTPPVTVSQPEAPKTSTALARPSAPEREAVRELLHGVVKEALRTDDRASFIKMLDSLDERAEVILGIFGRK